MPLNAMPTGKSMADYFITNAPAAGTPITKAQIEALWQGALAIEYTDLQTNMEIEPGTFEVSGTAVTGLGGPAL